MVPRRHVVIAFLLACLALVSACGGSASTTAPAVQCPPAAAVGAALSLLGAEASTGQKITSTDQFGEAMTTCNYSGAARTMVSSQSSPRRP